MTKKALGNNPLLAPEVDDTPTLTAEELEQAKYIEGVADDFTTMSFKVRKTHLKTLRDYAYTNRLEIKEALDQALEACFASIDTSALIESPDKPKKPRKRGVSV